jgi:hypothetical protein
LPYLHAIVGVAAGAGNVIGEIFTAIRQTFATPATGAEITPAVGTAGTAATHKAATTAEVRQQSSKWRRWKEGSSPKAIVFPEKLPPRRQKFAQQSINKLHQTNLFPRSGVGTYQPQIIFQAHGLQSVGFFRSKLSAYPNTHFCHPEHSEGS